MLHVKTLQPITNGRLVLVGDVHGCPRELDNLLNTIKFVPKKDVLLLVGDLVNKGYDSVGVVKRAIELNALAVMGNHDAKLLQRVDAFREGMVDPDSEDPVDQTAMIFPKDCYDYLHQLPHIIKIPQFNLIVVHAGLNPKQQVDNQSLWEILHMRRILASGRVIDAHAGGDLWASKWKGPETVVFGHDARRGFQEHPFAIGLDTGCCYGAELTALIMPGKEIVKVPGSKVPVKRKDRPEPLPRKEAGTPGGTTPPHFQPSPASVSPPSYFASPQGFPQQPSPFGQTPTDGGAIKNVADFFKHGSSGSLPPNPSASSPATTDGANNSGGSPFVGVRSVTDLMANAMREHNAKHQQRSPASQNPPPAASTSNGTLSGLAFPSSSAAAKQQASPASPPSAARSTPPSLAAPASSSQKANVTSSSPSLAASDLLRHIAKNAAEIATSTQEGALGLISSGIFQDHRDDILEEQTVSATIWCDLVINFVNGLARGTRGDDALEWIQDIVLARPDVLGVLPSKELLRTLDATAPDKAKGISSAMLKSTKVALR